MKLPQKMTKIERDVLALLGSFSDHISRKDIQMILFKEYKPGRDRYIRTAIQRLRLRGHVITSSSDNTGYRLSRNKAEVRHYVNETRKRARELMRIAGRVEKSHGLRNQHRMNLSS